MPEPNAADLPELVRRARNGSEEAAKLVFQRCGKPLLSIIRSLVTEPVRLLYDAEEFLDDTLTALFRNDLPEGVLRSPQNVWAWLRTTAKHKVTNANVKYGTSQRHHVSGQVTLEEAAEEVLGREPGADHSQMLKELIDKLQRLCEHFPWGGKALAELLLAGKSVGEMAEALHVPPQKVYRALRWVEEKLRD
jgi:DNA-directed RNA polymerase specialized sigma24 family protein